MKILAEVKFKNEDAAMIAGRFQTTEQIFQNQKFPSGTYYYVSSDAMVVAAQVATDATPIDEMEFLGRS